MGRSPIQSDAPESAQQVRALAGPDVRGHRDDRGAGQQAPDHRDDRVRRRLGEHRDRALGGPVGDLVGDHRGRPEQLGAGHRRVPDADRLGVVEASLEERSQQRHGAHDGHPRVAARGYPWARRPSTITRSFHEARASPPPPVNRGRRATIVGNSAGSRAA